MAFLEDPRLRQRWNQISHTTEAVTENAAAGIWTIGHQYINPCFASIGAAFESCTVPCFGDHEERARRRREREREAEYSFDFYDDWDEDLAGDPSHGGFGGWRGEDWDRLIGGTGANKNKRGGAGEVQEQPHGKKRGMSYGTRGGRRKSSVVAEDPTIIPSTQPIGFLGKLPFKIGGTLRYKPSAANLQDHPGASRHLDGESQPLLGNQEEEYHPHSPLPQTRARSGTTSSGDTSDSYRSRGDLFPSDEEGEEDAVPLDDEFAVALDRVDDRSSSRTKSSKGKRTASYTIPRSVSKTTMSSITPSRPTSLRQVQSPLTDTDETPKESTLSLKDLQQEEEQIQREEDEQIERQRQAAARLALERGLQRDDVDYSFVQEAKPEFVKVEDVPVPEHAELSDASSIPPLPKEAKEAVVNISTPHFSDPDQSDGDRAPKSDQAINDFVPARLPYFR